MIVEPDRHLWCAALVCLLAAVPAAKAQAREKATTVAVIGDSIGVGLQNGLYRVVPKSVRLVRLARDNTGLTRNRIYAWPAHVAADVKRYHVDTLVVMLGANDYQRIVVRRPKHRGVAILRPGSRAWSRVYRARVDALIAGALKAGVKRLLWVGLPIVRSPAQDRAYRRLNRIYRAAAAAHPAVDYFPTRGLTARRTKTGALAYHAYLKVGKRYYLFRNTRDGIHFTVFGYRYLARHVWQGVLAVAAARK